MFLSTTAEDELGYTRSTLESNSVVVIVFCACCCCAGCACACACGRQHVNLANWHWDDTQKKLCAVDGRKIGTAAVRKVSHIAAQIDLLHLRSLNRELRLNWTPPPMRSSPHLTSSIFDSSAPRRSERDRRHHPRLHFFFGERVMLDSVNASRRRRLVQVADR